MKPKKEPEKLGSILDSVLSERGYSTICKEYEVVARWPEIAGERLAAVSECTRAEDGILYVHIDSASWRQESVYLKKQLLSRIRKDTGCTTIRDIKFC